MNLLISNPNPNPNPLTNPFRFRAKSPTKFSPPRTLTLTISSRLDEPNQQQQLNLSVLRFTLGIAGFDESYLPRGIGYTFGALVVLNHFAGSAAPTSPAQLRSEALGLSLAAFSVALPYLGKFLKGATLKDKPVLPEGNKQIFAMSEHVSGTHKEDLAWGSYVLLKNTNTISVLISVQDALCARGYWNVPEDVENVQTNVQTLDWFERQVQLFGLSDLKDTLYFPQKEDSGVWEMLPKGTCSLLIQPVFEAPEPSVDETANKIKGFILLASSMSYAYSDKDRSWIGAVANKFRNKVADITS